MIRLSMNVQSNKRKTFINMGLSSGAPNVILRLEIIQKSQSIATRSESIAKANTYLPTKVSSVTKLSDGRKSQENPRVRSALSLIFFSLFLFPSFKFS